VVTPETCIQGIAFQCALFRPSVKKGIVASAGASTASVIGAGSPARARPIQQRDGR